MNKKYILFVFMLLLLGKLQAQYAVGGTSENYNKVYWLTWGDPNNPFKEVPAEFKWRDDSDPKNIIPGKIVQGTYVWEYSPDIRIEAIISVPEPEIYLEPYTPGTWTGDRLGYLYSKDIDGENAANPEGVPFSGMATPNGDKLSFDISLKVEFKINGDWTEIDYPGIVIADAEEMDGQGTPENKNEYISATTSGTTAWQLLDRYLHDGGNSANYKLKLSNAGKDFEIWADNTDAKTPAVMYAHGTKSLTRVRMGGTGVSALAIGFVFPFDLGDAPESYGDNVKHFIDSFDITEAFSADGTYSIDKLPMTKLTPRANVFIGADNVDADGLGEVQTGSDPDGANNDQLTGEPDEETLDVDDYPIKVNQNGDIVFQIPVTNRKTIDATLSMWMDFNGNGFFESSEIDTIAVPANTIDQEVSLTFPASSFTGIIKAGPLYSRLRITTSKLRDSTGTARDERSISLAADGETEDYRFIVEGVRISGQITNDGNGISDEMISGTGMGLLDGEALYAYLIEEPNGMSIEMAKVAADGSYAFTNVNPGNYSIGISTRQVAPPFAYDIEPELPNTWRSVGEAYGENNRAWNAGDPEVRENPAMLMDIVIPGDGKDIWGVDFALNRAPETEVISSTGNPASQAVLIELKDYISDAEDGLDLSSIQFFLGAEESEASNNLVIDDVGTFSVIIDAGITKIKFQPLPGFSGPTPLVHYRIMDAAGSISNFSEINIDIEAPTLFISNPMIYQRLGFSQQLER